MSPEGKGHGTSGWACISSLAFPENWSLSEVPVRLAVELLCPLNLLFSLWFLNFSVKFHLV